MPADQVLDLTSEFSEAEPLRTKFYLNVPMLDGVAPTLSQLNEAVDWLRTAMRSGPTFVHCALGHGRSATVAIAFLLAEGYANTVEEGLELVRKRRSPVRLSRGQRKLLDEWIAPT
jgi:protein-tyrosine phosphatase